jgi:hypothetical protein
MTPVAGGITDREKYRPVQGPREGKGLFSPGMPVNGIMKVLKQIGALLSFEVVHGASPCGTGPYPCNRINYINIMKARWAVNRIVKFFRAS